jgi:GxxExxY protein
MAVVNRQNAKDVFFEPSPQADKRAYEVIGAGIEVHRLLGPGFLESVYEHALARELKYREIPFEQQRPVGVTYKGELVGQARLDFLVDDCLIVEVKAVDQLAPIHTAQVISYLRATELQLGLLLNFNVPLLPQGMKRIVRSH